ncbi:MAG TPA: glycine cleavage system protein GcvH [Methylophilaceae bacterium]|nr:glycine cleavage system protein GcvH [Methylophilaceae bacterium]
MKTPTDLNYSPEHLWVRRMEDGTCLAGITDYAQDLLGDIVYVEAPQPGRQLEAGKPCGLVESVKTGSDLHAPLSGKVEAVNEALQQQPELINEDPYAAWIFRFRPHNPSEQDGLLDAAGYQKLLGET